MMTSSGDFILNKYPAEEIPEYLGGILDIDTCHQVSERDCVIGGAIQTI